VQKLLVRHRLGAGPSGVAALAQLTAATTGILTTAAKDGPFGFCHFAARPGDLVALDTFYVGKLKGIGPVWQLTAVDTATRYGIGALSGRWPSAATCRRARWPSSPRPAMMAANPRR
jgi:hypothetical protein